MTKRFHFQRTEDITVEADSELEARDELRRWTFDADEFLLEEIEPA